MKTPLLFSALLVCIAPVFAQPNAPEARFVAAPELINGLPFPLLAPEAVAGLLKGPPISLQLKDVTLYEALQQLQKQSGIDIDLSYNPDPKKMEKKLSLQMETTSFNRAFQEIMDGAGVNARLRRMGSDTPYRLELGKLNEDSELLQAGVAPLLMRLTSMNTTLAKTIDFSEPELPKKREDNALTLSFEMPSNPQLELAAAPQVRLTRAEDEKGRSLVAPKADDRQRFIYGLSSFSLSSTRFSQRLLPPAPDARQLARLEGVTIYALGSARERWEVPDALKAKGAEHEFQSNEQTFRAVLQSVAQKEEGFELKFEISTPVVADLANREMGRSRNPLLSSQSLSRAIRLEDANGKVLRSNGSSSNISSGKVTMTTRFRADNYRPQFEMVNGNFVRIRAAGKEQAALPLKFIFDVPINYVQTEVPFSFADLPLP